MELHIVIGLCFLGVFVFVAWKMYGPAKAVSPIPDTKAFNNFQSLLKTVPQTPAAVAKAQSPSRDQVFKSAFDLIDFANANSLPDVAKAISDVLPILAVKKGD